MLSVSINAQETTTETIEPQPNDSITQIEEPRWSITASHSQYNLKDKWEANNLLYVGYDNLYIQYHHGLYNQINVGAYVGNFLFDIGWRKANLLATVSYEHWLGDQTLRGKIRYNYNYDKTIDREIYPNTPIVGIGFGSYSEKSILTVDILKELEREHSWILATSLTRNITDKLTTKAGVSINDKGHYVLSNELGYGIFFINGSYHNNFDYTGLDYLEFGVGIKFKF